MSDMQIDVQVDAPISDLTLRESLPARLQQAALAAMAAAGVHAPGVMTLVITHDEQVQRLNRDYRGVDATTDVLAFPAAPNDGETEFAAPPSEEPDYLGDVIISLPQAMRQANELSHSLEDELCLLAVHGTLHLLGYDHITPADRAHMWPLQRAALRQLGCEGVAPSDG